jgi:hypothetical protein
MQLWCYIHFVHLFSQNSGKSHTKNLMTCFVFRYAVVQKLAHSNLILVVVDTLCSDDSWTNVRLKTEVKEPNMFCMKATNDELTRKRPKTCIGRDTKTDKVIHVCYWQFVMMPGEHVVPSKCESTVDVTITLC